ncbi:hypothetical protein QN360_01800 [Glaciimonas sp. CA11.2]|uniref:hypothetical protein n=1 Tax=unclassified Glaciimonas TaxID=2644401 RepID=UPI002AB5D206|nr:MULTISPECIES: hypothetical protein [unclassified Glaciimonas]MDY7545223.1 hypothetical protein [Glaciimonas sp. CA11.2]MEB0011263.1 hypothetical protein [Glaciimonas sp. Cout2]MEB0080913.1 hypothetical protein [Glaciimonas sp. Gout2]MEB0161640.1 hypothetical protein [Glaciimonas sp. CA11.2]
MDTTPELTKVVDQTGDGINGMVKEKSADLHSAIDKASDTVRPAIDRMANGAHTSVDQVSSALTDATESLTQHTRELSAAYQRFADTGRQYVRTSPVVAVGMALAAGYLISKLFSGKDH